MYVYEANINLKKFGSIESADRLAMDIQSIINGSLETGELASVSVTGLRHFNLRVETERELGCTETETFGMAILNLLGTEATVGPFVMTDSSCARLHA